MAQLLVALEKGTEPEIGGRDNLRTMELVDKAYQSASEHRAVTL
jgi:predicted dehydrogenase